ncbi:flagellar biosynthetic protein FlhB [Thioclava sp. ES.031]|uniref:EscU/YscU/HrcU family type III secretion system export apparatus switch protein n=1 Tax=Thioclava sp. ES.031 TaxID=1798203 RepID=UPI000BF95AD8|nr:flagellar type III secretion system protein FlhB [Thioclava sp. ES.031]PFG61609.1 flagellar biosynthetic protein FlhB [Thioclava sp. ES.031]
MSEDEAGEKEFDPTPHKLDAARRKGDLVRSTEISVAAVYGSFLATLLGLGIYSVTRFGSGAMAMLDRADEMAAQFLGGGTALGGRIIGTLLLPLAPFFVVPMIAALVAYWAQRAIVVAPDKIQPKLSRINPLKNAAQKFGRSGLFEFAKSATKLAVIATILFIYLRARADLILLTQRLESVQIVGLLFRMIAEFLMIVTALAATMGAIDYLWQRSEFLRRNRMTRKELTDEMKQSEGDPHLKAQRRQKGMELAMRQSVPDTAKADVVIVNPTHYAVALKWDRASGRAPVCLSKGVDAIAARIREIAAENAVPVHSDPPTARALFAAIEIGEEIRPEHYKPVAAAIRFAEKMRKAARGGVAWRK